MRECLHATKHKMYTVLNDNTGKESTYGVCFKDIDSTFLVMLTSDVNENKETEYHGKTRRVVMRKDPSNADPCFSPLQINFFSVAERVIRLIVYRYM